MPDAIPPNFPTEPLQSETDALVTRARTYAVGAHQRIDQRRKYSGQPYETHLVSVVRILSELTDDPFVLAAAWLHDVVEDTPATIEDIEREFGSQVAGLVDELTDVSRPSDGNRARRKQLDLLHLASASPAAQTIKLADLIDNCDDIFNADPRFGHVFFTEAEALLATLAKGETRLRKRLSRLLERWRSRLEKEQVPTNQPPRPGAGLHQRQILAHVLARFTASDLATPRTECAGKHSAQRQHLSPEASLIDVVQVLTRHRQCLVQDKDGHHSQIDREDFDHPVARMWLFGILTSIELDMRSHIRSTILESIWRSALGSERLGKARDLQTERSRRGERCDLLDCLQLVDYLTILLAQPAFIETSGFRSKKSLKRVFSDLEELRNHLAHGQPLGTTLWPSIARLARNLAEQAQETYSQKITPGPLAYPGNGLSPIELRSVPTAAPP